MPSHALDRMARVSDIETVFVFKWKPRNAADSLGNYDDPRS